MIDLHIALDEDQYHRLQRRALEQGISVEALISDLIEDDNAWQQSLANDAMASLFGQIEDALDPAKIDAILYSPRS